MQCEHAHRTAIADSRIKRDCSASMRTRTQAGAYQHVVRTERNVSGRDIAVESQPNASDLANDNNAMETAIRRFNNERRQDVSCHLDRSSRSTVTAWSSSTAVLGRFWVLRQLKVKYKLK